MENPSNLKYAKEQEWGKGEGDIAIVGITDHAQMQLTDIVFVELPEKGKEVEANKQMTTVKSVISVSNVFALVSGAVEKVKEIQAQEETKTEEVTEETMAEEVKEETKTDEIKEETMTEEEEKPVVETEPAQETTSSKVVSEISKGATGKPTMYLKEGDLVKLKLKATDPDGDMLTYSFARPLDENGEWQTTYGDEGRYAVTIKVSDGTYEVEQEILLMVQSVNKAPVLERMSDIDIKEGETVVLTLKATDLDGDTLSYTISGWMTSSTYKTEFNDAGEHTVKVCVSDGKQEDCNTIKITVNDVNRPPVFEI